MFIERIKVQLSDFKWALNLLSNNFFKAQIHSQNIFILSLRMAKSKSHFGLLDIQFLVARRSVHLTLSPPNCYKDSFPSLAKYQGVAKTKQNKQKQKPKKASSSCQGIRCGFRKQMFSFLTLWGLRLGEGRRPAEKDKVKQ